MRLALGLRFSTSLATKVVLFSKKLARKAEKIISDLLFVVSEDMMRWANLQISVEGVFLKLKLLKMAKTVNSSFLPEAA